MRISLFHNEGAGDGSSVDEITALLERHGHRVVHVIDSDSGADAILERGADLVVAAGGDGTVASAARVLAGQSLPLTILPLGTANNVAKSLCVEDPIDTLIEGWARATPRSLDLGIARGVWGERVFLESVGAGLIPSGIGAAKAQDESTTQPDDAAATFRDVLARLEAQLWTITIDGVETTERFLFVEVLNMPSIGPNLVLSDDGDPSDGLFSVVIATEQHREVLDAYLVHRIGGGDRPLSLTPQHGRHVEIHGPADVHVDDQLLRTGSSQTVSVTIQPAALQFLPGPCLAPDMLAGKE